MSVLALLMGLSLPVGAQTCETAVVQTKVPSAWKGLSPEDQKLLDEVVQNSGVLFSQKIFKAYQLALVKTAGYNQLDTSVYAVDRKATRAWKHWLKRPERHTEAEYRKIAEDIWREILEELNVYGRQGRSIEHSHGWIEIVSAADGTRPYTKASSLGISGQHLNSLRQMLRQVEESPVVKAAWMELLQTQSAQMARIVYDNAWTRQQMYGLSSLVTKLSVTLGLVTTFMWMSKMGLDVGGEVVVGTWAAATAGFFVPRVGRRLLNWFEKLRLKKVRQRLERAYQLGEGLDQSVKAVDLHAIDARWDVNQLEAYGQGLIAAAAWFQRRISALESPQELEMKLYRRVQKSLRQTSRRWWDLRWSARQCRP